MSRFYQVTEETSKKLKKAKLTAAEWRLWNYLSMLDPWGDSYNDLPDTLTILQEVEIKKTTFYAAIAKLQKYEFFDFQDKGFSFRSLQMKEKAWTKGVNSGNPPKEGGMISENRKVVQNSEQEFKNSESGSNSRTEFQENGKIFDNSENRPPKPPPVKRLPSPQTKQTYSDIKDTTELDAGGGVFEIFEKYGEQLTGLKQKKR